MMYRNALPSVSVENSKFASVLKWSLAILSGLCIFWVIQSSYLFTAAPSAGNSGSNHSTPNPVTTQEFASTTATSDVSTLVTDALAFKAMLTTTQQATLQQTYTATLARKWSNLPCGSGCRNGIDFGSLTTTQLAAAIQVIQDALGSSTDNGYDEFNSIRVAEDYLGTNGGGSGYAYDLTWIAFLNNPSVTGSWMLQFGGHHYAANIAINNGHVIGATPFFVALEPTTFTYGGISYAPMEDEHEALQEMLASLSSSELSTALLSTTFSDCLMSPGESNGNSNTFPTTKQGIKVSNLSTTQKNLVIAAIQNYVKDMEPTTASAVMQRYTDEIDDTYIAFTGNGTSGNPSSFLVSNSNYVRIDGPTVWIEFACQNGVIFPSQIHYHSVWRDHDHDYGVDLTGDPIDESTTAVKSPAETVKWEVYPNPGTDRISLNISEPVQDGKIQIVDLSGKTVFSLSQFDGSDYSWNVSSWARGTYILSLTLDSGHFTKRITLQ